MKTVRHIQLGEAVFIHLPVTPRHMGNRKRRHISYLLRLWQVKSEDELVWRASLESPHTRERRGFPSLAELFAFLERETGNVVPVDPSPRSDA